MAKESYLEMISRLEGLQKEALINHDAVVYATLCNELGSEIDAPDLYEQGLVDIKVQQKIYEEKRKRDEEWIKEASKPKSKNYIAYGKLLKESRKNPINNIYDPSDDEIKTMRERLESILGFKRLTGNQGIKVPIGLANPERVVAVYQKHFQMAEKLYNK